MVKCRFATFVGVLASMKVGISVYSTKYSSMTQCTSMVMLSKPEKLGDDGKETT